MTRTKKTVFLVLLLILFVGVTLGSMFYYHHSEKYTDHFLPGTQINSVDVGDMTVEEANAAMLASQGDYTLDVVFEDGSRESVSGQDIDFGYAPGDRTREILQKQNKFKWPLGYINILKEKYDVQTQFNRSKLSLLIHRMPQTQQDPETIDRAEEQVMIEQEKEIEQETFVDDAEAILMVDSPEKTLTEEADPDTAFRPKQHL